MRFAANRSPTPAEYQQWVAVRDTVWNEVAKSLGGKINLDMANKIHASQR